MLDQLAQIEEGDVVGDAAGLAQDMGDDDDRIVGLEGHEALLDDAAGLRIEGGRRLVAQNDLRLDGQPAGQAEALLLADGKAGRRGVEPVLDLVPQAGRLELALDDDGQGRRG